MKDVLMTLKFKNNLILKRAKILWGDISQSEMARKIGITRSMFGALVDFKENPITRKKTAYPFTERFYWKEVAIKIANALGTNPEELFTEGVRKFGEKMKYAGSAKETYLTQEEFLKMEKELNRRKGN